MFDGIEFRGFRHSSAEKLAEYSGVPVWNGLTDEYHPTQVLADLLTVREHLGRLSDLKFVYIGDGRNNVANSLMIGCSKLGIDYQVIAPPSLLPSKELLDSCKAYAKVSGSVVEALSEVKAAAGADVIYTDVWVSMGEEAKAAERLELLRPYQVNRELMAAAKDTAIFLHCLPAVKGNEVTEEVFEQYADVVFDEAENRMHTIKAVMVATLGD